MLLLGYSILKHPFTDTSLPTSGYEYPHNTCHITMLCKTGSRLYAKQGVGTRFALQGLVDGANKPGRYLLSGSHIIIEKGGQIDRAIEIKSSTTYRSAYFTQLQAFSEEAQLSVEKRAVIYAGDTTMKTSQGEVLNIFS